MSGSAAVSALRGCSTLIRRRSSTPILSTCDFHAARSFSASVNAEEIGGGGGGGEAGGGYLHHEWVVDGRTMSGNAEKEGAVVGEGRGTVVFLHGLLGSGKNLRAPAKKLTEMHPHLSALLLDLRGHGTTSSRRTLGAAVGGSGDGGGLSHSFEACAEDIVRTLHHLGLVDEDEKRRSPVGVVGHSFGGRVALQYLHALLQNRPPASSSLPLVRPPRSTWLLDTVPGSAHGSVAGVVEAVSSVRMPVESKKALVEELVTERGVDKSIAMWMTTNLSPSRDGPRGSFDFAFDLEVVRDVLDDFPRQDFAGMLRDVGEWHSESATSTGTELCRVNLVMAGKNKAWTEQVRSEVEDIGRMGHLDAHVLEKAGHWVHVDDLDGLMFLMEGGFD